MVFMNMEIWEPAAQRRGWQTFSGKGQMENNLGLVDQVWSVLIFFLPTNPNPLKM